MNRRIIYILMMAFGAFMLMSCQSKEEKVIDMYKSMIERIETEGADWSTAQWEEALEEIKEIEKYSESCNFSKQQLSEVSNLQGKLLGVVLKKGSQSFAGELEAYLKAASSFMEGFEESTSGLFDFMDFDYDGEDDDYEEMVVETTSESVSEDQSTTTTTTTTTRTTTTVNPEPKNAPAAEPRAPQAPQAPQAEKSTPEQIKAPGTRLGRPQQNR